MLLQGQGWGAGLAEGRAFLFLLVSSARESERRGLSCVVCFCVCECATESTRDTLQARVRRVVGARGGAWGGGPPTAERAERGTREVE